MRRDRPPGNHNERSRKISATTGPHPTIRPYRGRSLRGVLFSPRPSGTGGSAGSLPVLFVFLRFLVFDTAWVYGTFDDASSHRRLVGLSDQAASGGRNQDLLADDGFIYPHIVGNKKALSLGAVGR